MQKLSKIKPIIIVAGEPYSVFLEILFKTLKSKSVKKNKYPIILISSLKLVLSQMSKFHFKYKVKIIQKDEVGVARLKKNILYVIDVEFKHKKIFDKISSKSKNYIERSFKIGINLMKEKKGLVLINGPVSKINFLDKKYPGVTEYVSDKVGRKGKEVMLIYNKDLAVTPITTHVPLNKIFTKISIKQIVTKVTEIDKFYKNYLNKNAKIGITGLNPHCESGGKINEEKKIITPAIKKLQKKGIKISGPFPADTVFLKKNRTNFDVIVGMYHDQVLSPVKTLFEFCAINITLGLPFLRITPDHGPNNVMLGKNKSDPSSLIEAIKFIKNLRGN